jgi:hypothetical protein
MRDISWAVSKKNCKEQQKGYLLSRDPAPKLKRLFTNSPTTREVTKSSCMNGVLGERKCVLIVVEI